MMPPFRTWKLPTAAFERFNAIRQDRTPKPIVKDNEELKHCDDAESAPALLRENRFGEAIDLCRSRLSLHPGDAAAHLALGRALHLSGDEFQAESAYRDAVSYDPQLGLAYQRWGKLCLERMAVKEARSVFARWLEQCPGSAPARHWLAVAGEGPAPQRASAAFVTDLYAGFATDFDTVMQRVDYIGPMLVEAVLARELGTPNADLDVLDAGCGTGLCAQTMRAHARHLMGIDLSEAMLVHAAARGCYDDLQCTDLLDFAHDSQVEFDAVCCIEALIYFGDLTEPLAALVRTLRPGGLIVFTCEALPTLFGPADDDVQPFALQTTGRYAHDDNYIEAAMLGCGLESIGLSATSLRNEAGEPVNAWIASGRRGGG